MSEWIAPRGDEDRAHLAGLGERPFVPVFVMGLHRSGTTWLYEQLDRLVPVASVTAHSVLAYPRLLELAARGALEADRAALDAHFRQLGLTDRQIDAIRLHHGMVEEYGWVLLARAGKLHLDARTAPLLSELCRKLLVTRPEAAGHGTVLLKSPWDCGRGVEIKALYPAARFVFIRRDPLRIVDSQLRNGLLFKTTETPYLDSLIAPSRLARVVFGGQRVFSRVVGERVFASLAVRSVMNSVVRESHGYRRSLEGVPAGDRIEVRYEDLLREPALHLGRVIEFLGLAPREDPASVQPKPRERPLHPAVEARREGFLARLKREGLGGE